MKRFLRIHASKRRISEQAFEEICRLVPEGAGLAKFEARLPENDPRLDAVLEVLKKGGGRAVMPWEPLGPNDFRIRPNYEYEPEDFARAAYFDIAADASVDTYRDEDGTLLVPLKSLPAHLRFSGTGPGGIWHVVSDTFRQKLEAAGFRGLRFRPTRGMRNDWFDREVVPWEQMEGVDPIWELTSDVELPPVSPRVRLLDKDGRPVPRGDTRRGVNIYEGEFPAGELHYLKSEIAAVEPFDLALTRERFGASPDPDCRRLVVSRRFMTMCNDNGVDLGLFPVYVDDDA